MRRFVIPLFLVAALSGCQRVFTTSLGAALARDEVALPATLTADEAALYAEEAKENPALAAALVENLAAQVGDTVTAANVELAAIAASTAVAASGAGAAIFPAVEAFLADEGELDAATITELVDSLQEVDAGLLDAIKYLGAIGSDETVADSPDVGGAVSATDYALAAIIVAASALPEGVDNPADMTAGELAAFQAEPDYATAVDMLQAASAIADDSVASLLASLGDLLQIEL